jgi:hypothetical protein
LVLGLIVSANSGVPAVGLDVHDLLSALIIGLVIGSVSQLYRPSANWYFRGR